MVRLGCWDAARVLGKRMHGRLASFETSGGSISPSTSALHCLRQELDRRVVGQGEVKRAILLGLLAKEHVYVEGPPGVAKTLLSEAAASATKSTVYAYQFHRDSRLDELVGDRVVIREPAGAGAEVIRQTTRKGGLLTTDICVLDDISRAPGEALNVLLRLLNERRWTDGSPIPLVSAIATANPPRDDYFNEPLDPANLDRFTLQVKATGLVQHKHWHDAARVIEQFGAMPHTERSAALQDAGFGSDDGLSTEAHCASATSESETVDLSALHAMHSLVCVPRRVQRLILLLLADLVTVHGCTPANSLLTDRTFLVKAPRIMQAAAMLDGRNVCEPADLHVLSLLTTFRVPEKVQDIMHEIIDEIVRREAEDDEESDENGLSSSTSSTFSREQQEEQKRQQEEEREQEKKRRQEQDEMMKAMSDEGGLLRSDGVEKSGAVWSMQQKYPRVHEALRKLSSSIMTGGDAPSQNLDRETISNMDALLKIFGGKQQRSTMEEVAHHGGQPRRWRRMVGIEGLEDCEPVESSIWCQNVNPQMPRTVQRERQARGGSLAIVRDISASMWGMHSKWTSSVILRLIELTRRTHMRLGYIEFNEHSWKYRAAKDKGGHFFVRDYEKMEDLAQNLEVDGLTNYQKAINDALQEFSQPGLGTKNKHLLFLTDGAPTQGDAALEDEQAWAKRLGVSIHTVFIGSGDYPDVLDTLALSTNGARFQAIPEYETGVIRLWDREDGPPPVSPIDAAAHAMKSDREAGVHGEDAGHGSVAHNNLDRDLSSDGEHQSGALHKDNLAAKGTLSSEDMEKAMKLMELGRSPVSGNPVSGQGRFG